VHRFVALDVEISSRNPLHVCAVGAVRLDDGAETASYSSLVATAGRVHYTDIHGLTAADLHDAPSWPEVWRRLLGLLPDIDTVVAFRATFDRAALLTMCGRHGLRMPRLRFVCAAELAAARLGHTAGLAETMAALELAFPGRPHDPLADARAAAAIALACWR
jgi:DNA polymerase-3 subunit epsilon